MSSSAASARLAKRCRATSAAAAAPNSRIIGGAGTSVPPLLLDVELLLEEDVLDDVEEEVDVELDVLVDPPKLDELTLPDEVETPPVEVETPPVDVLTPPVDVDTPPVDVDVLDPPDVEETPPVDVEVLDPPDPPDDVLVEPVLVDDTTMLPLLPPPLPPKKPPKNPPPNPPPNPPLPPTTMGMPPPRIVGISAMAIAGAGRALTVVVVTPGAHVVTVRTTRRFTLRTA